MTDRKRMKVLEKAPLYRSSVQDAGLLLISGTPHYSY